MASSSEGSYVSLLGSPRIFVHDLAVLPTYTKISKHELGIKNYDRVLAIARPEDVVILLKHPEPAYLNWLWSVGLGTRKILVLPGKKEEPLTHRLLHPAAQKKILQMLGSSKRTAVLVPYYPDATIAKVSKQLGIPLYASPASSRQFAGKVFFEKWCRKIGVPVIPDRIVRITNGKKGKQGLFRFKAAIKSQFEATGHVIVRGDFGSGGSTTHVLERYDEKRIEEFYRHTHRDEVYIIEPFYKARSSPSSIWFITKRNKVGTWKTIGKAIHLKTSLQLFKDGVQYIGNEYPGRPSQFDRQRVMSYSKKIVHAMARAGYRGVLGIDFLQTNKGLFVMECNPRMTGSVYAWELVKILEQRHGRVTAALAEKITPPERIRSFQDLRRAWKGLLYDGTRSSNVLIPYNISLIRKGIVTVVAMGRSREKVHAVVREAMKRLV